MRLKEIGQHARNTLTIMGPIVNMIGGGPIWPLNEHKNPHYGNDIRYSYERQHLWIGKWLHARFEFANHLASH